MNESRITLVVRSTEIDINGHVNNAKYLEYLEWGREDFYERAKLDYDTLIKLGVFTVSANISINYRREAKQNDVLTVITRPGQPGNKSFVFHQTILREADDTLIADASVTLVTVDAKTRKSTPLPAKLRSVLQSE
ncbi:acyl-CoA thioesterase [Ferroacidibacillus organovorans]|uniref:Thioesterase n=1 Tax=Ferroacidibacillus organovorans TaxID=1765683 RepID=A0A162SEE0_9BACL|nr:thioesterase family protein [Ferroacidibacillus organovorans]KYP79751.1 thioesterase [Ferroacidibacillus organovorans]OAG95340.1 thioesterase [Ferroacidibacillus organovorans]OPG15824.1 thioesterase [Ferroacidibacillus organovorans]